ncbi:hypothetical protein N9L18_01100 [Candidatus Pacebacteria bacterium]|nr:hypothetical protein [Candidatus Paceibacterota bacterium]
MKNQKKLTFLLGLVLVALIAMLIEAPSSESSTTEAVAQEFTPTKTANQKKPLSEVQESESDAQKLLCKRGFKGYAKFQPAIKE